MKKRMLVLVMAMAMTVAGLTACGDKKTDDAEPKTEDTAPATDESAADDAAASDSLADNLDSYLEWTKEDWDAASDEEKQNAAIAFSIGSMTTMGIEMSDQDIKDAIAQIEADTASVDKMISQTEAIWAGDGTADMTLKEILDMTKEALGSEEE